MYIYQIRKEICCHDPIASAKTILTDARAIFLDSCYHRRRSYVVGCFSSWVWLSKVEGTNLEAAGVRAMIVL